MDEKKNEILGKIGEKANGYAELTRFSVWACLLVWAIACLFIADGPHTGWSWEFCLGIGMFLLPFAYMAYLGLRGLSHILNALVLILKAGNDMDTPSESDDETPAQ